jgi:hypothetical protein
LQCKENWNSFSLHDRTIAVLGGEGLLGLVAVETIKELGGHAISIDVKARADYICNVATEHERVFEIAGCSRYSGVINCVVGNQQPVDKPANLFDDDLQAGLTAAAWVHDAFHATLRETQGAFLNIGSDLSLKAPTLW